MKLAFFLPLLTAHIFCANIETKQLLNPEIFDYVCSQEWTGKRDNQHFFELLRQLNSRLEFNEKFDLSGSKEKEKTKKRIIGRLIDWLYLQETQFSQETLEFFLQIISDYPLSLTHEQNCLACQKNVNFFIENMAAIKNLIKFVCLNKKISKNNAFKWAVFIGTLISIFSVLCLTKIIFEEKYQKDESDFTQQNNLRKKIADLEVEIDQLKQQASKLLEEQNQEYVGRAGELEAKLIQLKGEVLKVKKQASLRLNNLEAEISTL